ncbi:interleukin-1 receptor type 2-like [Megalops cyprinoides]|uniref:interleukin-1 receptor type 2-like n=1 Tax=Megalops cyprinoides TaxID=118141 RepID=UPI00186457E8|nr:interleukin-1 receptor type 2-like [Megalops cyprinoides]
MRQAHTSAALRSPCRTLFVILLASAVLDVIRPQIVEPQSSKIRPSIDLRRPQIVKPQSSRIKASIGKPLVIPCKADPGFPDDFTLIYWIVNRTFIETAYPDGRIQQSEEKNFMKDGSVLIQRDLTFKEVVQEDLRARYTCVVTSATGIDRNVFVLKSASKHKPRQSNESRKRRSKKQL